MDISALETEGFVTIPYPVDLRDTVTRAMGAWRSFCDLPNETKVRFSLHDRVIDFGYMHRQDGGGLADDKELFHVVGYNMDRLRGCDPANGLATAFINAADDLITGIRPIVHIFAQKCASLYDVPELEAWVRDSESRWTFRFLHYFGGWTLAHPHVDRGGFTLHLGESCPGGEYLSRDGVWHPWELGTGSTVLFPSMGGQYYLRNKVKALCHRVMPSDELPPEGRYVMVAFIDFGPEEYDQSNGRLQERLPGFNYFMSGEEIGRLFKSLSEDRR